MRIVNMPYAQANTPTLQLLHATPQMYTDLEVGRVWRQHMDTCGLQRHILQAHHLPVHLSECEASKVHH